MRDEKKKKVYEKPQMETIEVKDEILLNSGEINYEDLED